MTTTIDTHPIDDFIARWSASAGAERANFQGFAYELCDLLGVPRRNFFELIHDNLFEWVPASYFM